jgi:xanthine dehydrogenase accessory factor
MEQPWKNKMLDVIEKAHELKLSGQPFAVATVVWVERPTSAKPGAKAIITQDGDLIGWIGGSCAEPTVKRESRKVLEEGRSRLVRLCPPEKRGVLPQEGVDEITLTCVSGGTMEIFIEPMLAQPQLVIFGYQSIAQALSSLGKTLGFTITVMGPEIRPERFPMADRVISSLDYSQLSLKPNTYVVVASHGNYDEDALMTVLQSQVSYVALVASKKRAESVLEYLRGNGLPEDRLAFVKYPAGLDIGASTPEEIALSILAEIVEIRRHSQANSPLPEISFSLENSASPEDLEVYAIDPICGMSVEVASAHYKTDYEGRTFYFCSRGCQRSFEEKPQEYTVTT